MSFINGIVTKPTQLRGNGTSDVEQALGIATGDIGTACTSGNINKWAKFKPFRNSHLDFATKSDYDDARENGHYGTTATALTRSVDGASDPQLITFINTGKANNGWGLESPRGGSSEWYRLFDFDGQSSNNTLGYKPAAICPFAVIAVDTSSSTCIVTHPSNFVYDFRYPVTATTLPIVFRFSNNTVDNNNMTIMDCNCLWGVSPDWTKQGYGLLYKTIDNSYVGKVNAIDTNDNVLYRVYDSSRSNPYVCSINTTLSSHYKGKTVDVLGYIHTSNGNLPDFYVPSSPLTINFSALPDIASYVLKSRNTRDCKASQDMLRLWVEIKRRGDIDPWDTADKEINRVSYVLNEIVIKYKRTATGDTWQYDSIQNHTVAVDHSSTTYTTDPNWSGVGTGANLNTEITGTNTQNFSITISDLTRPIHNYNDITAFMVTLVLKVNSQRSAGVDQLGYTELLIQTDMAELQDYFDFNN